MDETHPSLLFRARAGDESAWADLTRLYRPLLVGWLRLQSVPADATDDVVQDILLAVVRQLPGFDHSGRRGAFRAWLRTIAHRRACDFWEGRRRDARLAAGAADALARLADTGSDLNRVWDEEHDRYVLRCLLDLMDLEFEPTTARAFRRVALDGASGEEAARELGLSVGAVYAARSRVLRRLREEAAGLIDDLP